MFDTNALLSQTISNAGDIQRLQVPEGDWPVLIEELKLEERQHPKMNDNKPFVELRLRCLVDSQEVRDQLRRDKVIHTAGIILDTTKVGGMDVLDMSPGMNANLNQLREALGMNKDGEDFKLPMLQGGYCMATFRHKTSDSGINANITKWFKRS